MSVYWAGLSVLLSFASLPSTEHFLTVATFKETGARTKGDGALLAGVLEWELTNSGSFHAIADADSQRARSKVIARTNRLKTDDRYWVELGHEVGASHLLRGEIWETARSCYARAKLIELSSGKTKVTSPEPYDCSEHDLRSLAGELSMQLIGRRSSSLDERPLSFKIIGQPDDPKRDERTRIIDVPPIPTLPPPAPPPVTTPIQFVITQPNPPPVAPSNPDPPPPQVVPIPFIALPIIAKEPPSDRLAKFPGFVPREGTYSVYDLALDIERRALLFAGLILLIPVLGVFAAGIAIRISRDAAVRIINFLFGMSILVYCVDLAAISFFAYELDESIFEAADPLLVAAPFTAILVWLVGGKMIVTYGEMRLFRRILSLILYSSFFLMVLMIASAIHLPAWTLGVATLAFWIAGKLTFHARRKRNSKNARSIGTNEE